MAAALAPDRIAAFGYAHVPWFKTRQRLIEEADLPDTSLRFAQAAAIRAALEAHGYVAIGFDHFARPGDPLARAAADHTLKRSFQGYSCDSADALIGLGASAISTLPQGYAQNIAEPGAWARAIDGGAFATARGVALSAEDRTRRAIIERLLCDFEVDLGPDGGASRFADALRQCAPLAADGLARIEGDTIAITPRGRPFARLVAQCFDAYRAESPARHSRSV
jgi:oxygen-independent coproporphyrinogen-3 oxidase